MQDRFRFRVWHYKEKVLGNVDYICWDTDFIDFTEVGSDKYWDCVKMSELSFMQCTGLKDRNDKLIFEGDIVEIDWKDSRYEVAISQITWDQERSQFCVGIGSQTEVSWSHKVIGNIYENPELLENEK
jgi:uncharacterized phage protein (TIGR01671 family)